MRGALALVGAGEYLPPMDPVDHWLLARLPRPARVVCLPTGAGTEGEARVRYWMDLGIEHFRRLGADVEALPVVDRRSAQAARWVRRVEQADLVYLSGGKPNYLHATLADTPVLDAMLAVLDGGGVVAGCSAGAMIWGEQFRSLRTGPDWLAGFNRAPGAIIIPHFDEMPPGLLAGAWASAPDGLSLLGVDRDTALVLADERAQVVGVGGVTVWNHARRQRYSHGDNVTWP